MSKLPVLTGKKIIAVLKKKASKFCESKEVIIFYAIRTTARLLYRFMPARQLARDSWQKFYEIVSCREANFLAYFDFPDSIQVFYLTS
mgnify:CR=1 FL=1